MNFGLRSLAVVIGSASALALSSCSTQQLGSGLTINEAKSQAQGMEDRIAALVPNEYVERSDQAASGTLLSCGKNLYQWFGRTHLALKGDPDFEHIVRTILAGLKPDHDYDVRMARSSDGTPRVDVRGLFQAYYIASPSDDETQYEIESSSPCFQLPDGVSPRGEF
jgi:hypothetical protein